jgi:predicted dehydrogenase
MDRRQFLSRAGAAVAVTTLGASQAAKAAVNERVAVCVMGVRGRGNALLNAFASLPTVDVKYVCDLDETVLKSRTDQVASLTGRRPEPITDFRRALDDKNLDAIVAGTPDHWHALPAIMACQAGKDVYTEKPDAHNILEGQTMVAAAKRHKRIIQLGTQGRSSKHLASASEYIASGSLGRVIFAKAWESAKQGAIAKVPDSDPPAGFDYDFWLGPAPKRPFNKARFHGNWRWFFDYGTGDLGNDGVHRLDNALRALNAGVVAQGGKPLMYPRAVSSIGGKYYFDDAQEWPDTLQVNYDYPGYVLTYELRIWTPYPLEGESEGALVYGDGGYIVIGNGRWRAYDAKGKVMKEDSSGDNTSGHAQNFIDCMHSRQKPNADLETVGHPSSMLCHLGNASWRAGRTLKFDPETYTFTGDADANQYLTRAEYRKPWLLPKIADL